MKIDKQKLQDLVDICFEIGLTVRSQSDYFKNLSQEDTAKWIASQLEQCGYPTSPCGACWGLLETSKMD